MAQKEYYFVGDIKFWRNNPEHDWKIQIQPVEGGTQSTAISNHGFELFTELLDKRDEPLVEDENSHITIDGDEYVRVNTIPESQEIEAVAEYIANYLPHRHYEVRDCTSGSFEGGWHIYAGPVRDGPDAADILTEIE
ncbi:hypothetical protein [Salinibaculum rarum]|uniref:hypothetical protein n=1 Tax=Salinibaculum rarum TaxID=3058903 RepID=UPI0026601005|nr:hypothetical protein [Salinibaculum sp. KK48]